MMLATNGQFCDCCGVCADSSCIKKVDQTLKCKDKVNKNADTTATSHLWVKGNLPTNCICLVCKEDVDYHAEPGIYGYRCSWCQRSTHTECFSRIKDTELSDDCDFGPFKNMIIPPSSLEVIKSRSRKLQLTAIKAPTQLPRGWKPLFVIGKNFAFTNIFDYHKLFKKIYN